MGDLEKRRLEQLADEINEKHRAFEAGIRKTLDDGIRCGELLLEAKEQCEHGTWLPWLAANFDGSERSAQGYMRLYRRRDELRANTQGLAYLGIEDALKELAAPKPLPFRVSLPEGGQLTADSQEELDEKVAVHIREQSEQLDRETDEKVGEARSELEAKIEEREEVWRKKQAGLLAKFGVEPTRTIADELGEADLEALVKAYLDAKNERRDEAVRIINAVGGTATRVYTTKYGGEEVARHVFEEKKLDQASDYIDQLEWLQGWIAEYGGAMEALASGKLRVVPDADNS
jgi:hypothetical protein